MAATSAISHRSTICPTSMALKVITIDKFDGGRSNFMDQATIGTNMCVSGSRNVWAVDGVLTKTPGYTLQISVTSTSNTSGGFYDFYFDDSITTAYQIYYRTVVSATGQTGASRVTPWASTLTLTESLTALGYTTGTISISGANLISATGNGTSWLTHASATDMLTVSGLGGRYFVSSVEDNTHLTLAAAVPSSVATGTSYVLQTTTDNILEVGRAALNGSICWCSTAFTMQRYDGTGILRMPSAPSVAFLATHKGYMFGARAATGESRLYWSAINDPTSWPANNFVDIDKGFGKISGMHSYGPELIVFKTNGMYKVIGDIFDPSNPQYSVLKISTPSDFQFSSNNSVAIHNGVMHFFAAGRVYQYKVGTFYVTDISKPVIFDMPRIGNNLSDSINNIDQLIFGVSYNDFYILNGMQTSYTSTAIYGALMLDRNNAWWIAVNTSGQADGNAEPFAKSNRMAVIPQIGNRPKLMIGQSGGAGARIFTWNVVGTGAGTGTYDKTYYNFPSSGTPVATTVGIEGVWKSKEFNIEYGTFKWIIIYLTKTTGNLTVEWSIDQSAAVSYTLDMSIGRGNIIRAVIPINQKGSTIQLTLSNSTINQTFRIYGIQIVYEESPLERIQ